MLCNMLVPSQLFPIKQTPKKYFMGAVGWDDSMLGCYDIIKSEVTCLNKPHCILIWEAMFKYWCMKGHQLGRFCILFWWINLSITLSQAEHNVYSQNSTLLAPEKAPSPASADGYLFTVNGKQLHCDSLPSNKRKACDETANLLCMLLQTDILWLIIGTSTLLFLIVNWQKNSTAYFNSCVVSFSL